MMRLTHHDFITETKSEPFLQKAERISNLRKMDENRTECETTVQFCKFKF